MNIRPWTEMKRLRVELRAARLSCAARTKQVNRLTSRAQVLDRACAKHRAQAAHDQQYIDRLESIIEGLGGSDRMDVLRQEMRA